MATLKDQIDGVCKELKVTVKEGGLIAQVKAAAELCGLEYTSLKDTAAALVKEVLGESEDAPAAAGDGDGDGDAVLSPDEGADRGAARCGVAGQGRAGGPRAGDRRRRAGVAAAGQEAEEGIPQGPGDADAGSRAEEVGRALLLRHSLRQLL